MAPILSFTAEEVWQHLPKHEGKTDSVYLADFPIVKEQWINEALSHRMEVFQKLRNEVLKSLEKSRQTKEIGNSLEAKAILSANGEVAQIMVHYKNELADLLQVSQVEIDEIKNESVPEISVKIMHAEGKKCERCWRWNTEVGQFEKHPTLCGRCHEALESLV